MARRKVDTARGVRGTRRRNTGDNNGQTKSDPALNEALGKHLASSLMGGFTNSADVLSPALREAGINPNSYFGPKGNFRIPFLESIAAAGPNGRDVSGMLGDTGGGPSGGRVQNGGPPNFSNTPGDNRGHQGNPNANLNDWIAQHNQPTVQNGGPMQSNGGGGNGGWPGGEVSPGGQGIGVNPGGTIHNHGGTRHDHQGGGPGHKHDGGGGNPDPNWNPGFTGDPAARFQAKSPVPTGQRAANLMDRFNNYGQYEQNFQNRIPSGPNGSDYGIYAIPPISRQEWQQMVNGGGVNPGGPRQGGGNGGGNGGGQGGGGGQPTFDPSQFQRGDARPYDPSQLLGNGNNAYTPDMTNQQVRAQWGPQGFGLNGQPGYQNAYGQPQTQPMQGGGGQPAPHSHGGQPHAHPQGDQPHGHGQGGAGGGAGGQGGQAGGGGQGGGAGGGGPQPDLSATPGNYPTPNSYLPPGSPPVPGAGTPMTQLPPSLTTPPPSSYPWAGKGYMAPPSNMSYYNPGVGGFSGLQPPTSAPVDYATADQLAQQFGLQIGPGSPPNQVANPSGGTQPWWADPAPQAPGQYDPWVESRLIGRAYQPTGGDLGGFQQAYLQAAGGDNAYTRLAMQEYLAHKAGYGQFGSLSAPTPYGYVAPHG